MINPEILSQKNFKLNGIPPQHPVFDILFCVYWHMSNRWYNTNIPRYILVENLENIESNESNREILVNSQFNLTTDYDPEDIFLQCLGIKSNRIDHQVKAMLKNKTLLFYLRNYCDRPWNYMWFDFVNKYPLAITYLQGLNFSNVANLIIVSCEINDKDVTSLTQSLVSRGTSLYIVDFKKDYDLKYSSGKFKIQYSYQVGQIRFSIHTTIIKFSSRFDKSQFVITYPTFLKKRNNTTL